MPNRESKANMRGAVPTLQDGIVGGEHRWHVHSGVIRLLGACLRGGGRWVRQDEAVLRSLLWVAASGSLDSIGRTVGQDRAACVIGRTWEGCWAVIRQDMGGGVVASGSDGGLRGQLAVHHVVHVLAILAVLPGQTLLNRPGGGQMRSIPVAVSVCGGSEGGGRGREGQRNVRSRRTQLADR